MSAGYEVGEVIEYSAVASLPHVPSVPSVWTPILDALEKLPVHSGVVVKTEYTRAQMGPLRALALRRGFGFGMRKVPEGWLVFKRPYKMRDKTLAVAEACYERYIAGETLQQIADSMAVSRQAVEQRLTGYKTFTSLPSGNARMCAANEFIAPFLANVGDQALCILCQEVNGRRMHGVCGKCAKVIEIRSLVAGRLRSYKANGKRNQLAMATQNIRQYGLKPEDLKGY